MIQEKYKPIVEFALNSVEGIKRTGIQVLEFRENYAKALMPLLGNINHVGMMYAGSLFTLGEISGGLIHIAAFDVEKYFPIVKDVSIRFRRPALTDVTMEVSLTPERVAEIQAEADQTGKADYQLDLELKDGNGESVSLVTGTWQIRRLPEGMESPFKG